MNSKTFLYSFLFIFSYTLIIGSNDETPKKLKKTNIKEHYSKFNINNISTFIYNDGNADIDPNGNSGFIYPSGSNKAVVFSSGLVWGGKVNGKILVGGSTYSQGLYGGKILENGKAEDPNDEKVRVYRVRPDYKTSDLKNEILDENKSEEEIRFQYEKDWNEWPAIDGAPFNDEDNDGIYNPEIDIPGIPGASQTLWYVANDLDSDKAKSLYGSPSMRIELQVTVWGYSNFEVVNNILFKKYILINKSKNKFAEMYVSQWSDPDVGDAGDDFVGCDTTLSLGYAYNGDSEDGVYGEFVPAVGFKFLQGPLVKGNSNDIGKFKGIIINGYKNLPMSSFIRLLKNYNSGFDDPNLGDYELGTLQMYYFQQGIDAFGNNFIDPVNKNITKFSVPGDPITKSGWYEDIIEYFPGDRRMLLNSGPFTMDSGDTQEVIIAEIAAGGEPTIDRFEAIKLLKAYNGLAQEFYNYDFYQSANVPQDQLSINKIELDREIILTWYEDENTKNIESGENLGYSFQGYTIYQFPNRNFSKSEAIEIVTFDINDGNAKIISPVFNLDDKTKIYEIIKNGSDSGLKRHTSIKENLFGSENQLNNGTEYYFGISTYLLNKNNYFYPKILESEIKTITAIPQLPKPGEFFPNKYGDELFFYKNDEENFQSKVTVVDPTKLLEGNYKLTFNGNSSWQNVSWNLSLNDNPIQQNQKIIFFDPLGKDFPVYFNGLEIYSFVVDTNNFDPSNMNYEFTFHSSGSIHNNQELAKKHIESINVFPNPYYCTQVNEIHQFDKYVTFSHLPQKAKIRIFNLAGHLIRTINKNDESQFLRWDLTNENNFWIASGVYIVYIELPEIGETKILKLAVLIENVVPDYF